MLCEEKLTIIQFSFSILFSVKNSSNLNVHLEQKLWRIFLNHKIHQIIYKAVIFCFFFPFKMYVKSVHM